MQTTIVTIIRPSEKALLCQRRARWRCCITTSKTVTQQAGQLTAPHFTAQVFTGLRMAQCLWATTHNNNSNNNREKNPFSSQMSPCGLQMYESHLGASWRELWRQRSGGGGDACSRGRQVSWAKGKTLAGSKGNATNIFNNFYVSVL